MALLCVYVNTSYMSGSVINEHVRGLDYSEVSNVDTISTNDQEEANWILMQKLLVLKRIL